jgi:hypothetical protein
MTNREAITAGMGTKELDDLYLSTKIFKIVKKLLMEKADEEYTTKYFSECYDKALKMLK